MRPLGALRVRRVDTLDGPRLDILITDMHRHQRLAPRRPLGEAGIEGDARKFALQVERICLTIHGIVQHGIDIVEDRILGDAGFLAIMRDKLVERPVGDVVDTLTGFGVAVAGDSLKAVRGSQYVEISWPIRR